MLKVLEGGRTGDEKPKKATTNARAQAGISATTAAALLPLGLDDLAREGARMMIAHALQVEAEDYIRRHSDERDRSGRALVVRNGTARKRSVTLGAGTVEMCAPRVNDKRVVEGERQRFQSRILPPYARKSPKVEAVLPVLYLRGLSSGDVRPALRDLLGDNASGLSASAITRLTATWQQELQQWQRRSLADRDYVYVWVDGVHFNIRLEEDPLAALVVIGVRPDGKKDVVAIEDGYRESEEGWLSLLRGLKARGMRAPALAVGDGALGFWNAKRQVWPTTKEQRCWFHKLGNVLDKLPKRLQATGKEELHKIMFADTRNEAEAAMTKFTAEHGTLHPAAVKCLTKDKEELLAFFAFPAEHWKHLRTTNPIESSFATVRLRTRVTKGAGSRQAGIAMTFKLLLVAQDTWRHIDGQELVPLVRAGVRFVDGRRVERAHRTATSHASLPQQPTSITTKDKRQRTAA